MKKKLMEQKTNDNRVSIKKYLLERKEKHME